MTKSLRVLAYITAFLDEASLSNCIKSVVQQNLCIEELLIVDNSPSPLAVEYQNCSINMVHFPENIGVGGGVAFALQKAIGDKYDFLWLFDQDSRPMPDCLENLVKVYEDLSQSYSVPIGIIAPRVIDEVMQKDIGGAEFSHYRFREKLPNWLEKSWIECDAPITSGSLISIAAAKTVEPPSSDLFLDGVDLDYGLRLKKKGFRNIITSKAVMQHHLGHPLVISNKAKKQFIHNYPRNRIYYYHRNHTYLEVYYSQFHCKLLAALYRIKVMIRDIVLTLLYREKKLSKIYASVLGTLHGFQGKLGKLKASSILLANSG